MVYTKGCLLTVAIEISASPGPACRSPRPCAVLLHGSCPSLRRRAILMAKGGENVDASLKPVASWNPDIWEDWERTRSDDIRRMILQDCGVPPELTNIAEQLFPDLES